VGTLFTNSIDKSLCMSNLLHSLFHSISTANTDRELRSRFMDGASACFGVQRWGIYLTNDDGAESIDVNGVCDDFVDRYQTYGKFVDPVLQYVLQYHAPAHEELVLPLGSWKQCELYQICCAQYQHEHIMTGPIVGNGRLIGTINFARVGDRISAFNEIDLASLSAVCSHFSTQLASLKQPQREPIVDPLYSRLSPRELQIVNLVAQGLTNAEIGTQLWISHNSVKQALKRMFRKLEVSTRTEMVAKLRDLL
jgi:DNA-binding CsgD family transcriptional regulator